MFCLHSYCSSCHKSAEVQTKPSFQALNTVMYLWCNWNFTTVTCSEMIGTANCRAAEVNSLKLGKLPGCCFFLFVCLFVFYNDRPWYEATLCHACWWEIHSCDCDSLTGHTMTLTNMHSDWCPLLPLALGLFLYLGEYSYQFTHNVIQALLHYLCCY